MVKVNQVLAILGFLLVNLLIFQRIVAKEENKFIDYLEKIDFVLDKIEDGLFLGSFDAASSVGWLKSLNITPVDLTVASLPSLYPNDFTYKTISVKDTKDVNLSRFFRESFAFIDEARRNGGKVLVHCLAGISRSPATVVAYLMKDHRLSLSDALKYVKCRRPVISLNTGFRRQLVAFEESLKGSIGRFRTEL